MRVLITGSGGFTARHLARRLRREPDATLFGLEVRSHSDEELSGCHVADVGDYNQVVAAVKELQPDWIFHLAGVTGGPQPQVYRVNAMGTVHVLEAARESAPEARILLVGSAAEYGVWPPSAMPLAEDHECRPVGAYGLSKHATTLAGLDYAKRFGMKVVVARPFNLVGAGLPASLVVGAVLDRAKQALTMPEPMIQVGNLEAERDFVAVEDAVDAYVALMKAERWGEVFNICSGQAHSVRSVVQTLLSFFPESIEMRTDPALMRPLDAPVVVGNGEKIKRACGFAPRIALNDALHATWMHAVGQSSLDVSQPWRRQNAFVP